MLFSEIKNAKNEEIREYIPVSQSLAFDKIKPSIAAAERDFLLPLIGQATLTALQLFYDNTGSGLPEHEDEWQELLARCQRSVINMAFFVGFDIINAEIDDSGFGRIEGEHRKSMFKYQEDNLREVFRTDGFNSFDSILTYLHENISVFTAYASSTEYTRYKTLFFRSAASFDEVYYIGKSNLTFMRLCQYIRVVEDFELKKLMGPTLWAYVKTEIAKATPAAKVTALLPYIKNALSYLSVAYLMEDTGADLTANGLFFQAWASAGENQLQKQPADKERVDKLVARNREIGNNYVNEMKTYLTTNVTDWPTFETIPGYFHNRANAGKKTFWV